MSSGGCEGGELGSEAAAGLSGEVALEAADRSRFGLALSDATAGVAAGSFAVAGPDDGDHMQGAVGVAAPQAAQSGFRGLGGIGEPVGIWVRPDEPGLGFVRSDQAPGDLRSSASPSDRFPSKALGCSRDRRANLPEVMLGFGLRTGGGTLISHWAFTGNASGASAQAVRWTTARADSGPGASSGWLAAG